jgi:NitT/TauT family transport system ATP-binding protein
MKPSDSPAETASSAPTSLSRQPRILLKDVSKSFSTRSGTSTEAVRDLNLSVEDHTFLALLGPSGCGKTTVLRLIDGLLEPDSGCVLVSGRRPRAGPQIGFVFQSFRLIPWSTVAANVEFVLQDGPLSREDRRERVARYLELVGLTRFGASYPVELSGGMKQRVALARALASEPEILLMDEPFASIDAQTRELMQIELMRLWDLRRSVVIFVTHSVDEALLLADKISVMGPRPGRILETLDVRLPRPRWEYDARAQPRFIELRAYLWSRMRELVLSDMSSDFYGREIGSTEAPIAI